MSSCYRFRIVEARVPVASLVLGLISTRTLPALCNWFGEDPLKLLMQSACEDQDKSDF